MSTAIIADAHIGGPGGPPAPLIRQLEELGDGPCRRLILLGDLFHVWVGDRRYQTPEIRKREFNELMSLRPSSGQFMIYGPSHDTPLYHRLKREGRLIPEVVADRRKHDGFYLGHTHPHIGMEEMESTIRWMFHEEFERLGPSVFRVVEDWVAGYETLKDHPRPRVRAKARHYAASAHGAAMLIPASRRWVNPRVGKWLAELKQRVESSTGPLTRRERLASRLVPAMLWYTDFKLRHDLWQQPKLERKSWRMEEAGAGTGSADAAACPEEAREEAAC